MRGRVLVVDDDRAILEVLEMRLSALGLDVNATADPRHAMADAERERFDLALLDLRMDAVDGIALMEAIHRHQPRLPVLIMTAHGTIATAVEAVQRGAFDYLTKPFVRDELRTKIARALASRRWARDRGRLLSLGETLSATGDTVRVLEAVTQAAGETIEAERCVVFLLEDGRLVPRATSGTPPAAPDPLAAVAEVAMRTGAPATGPGSGPGIIVAAPLLVGRGPVGALVIETAARVEPGEDDLELLSLFSAQAAVAIRNSHELERLRSGALAALGRMAAQVAHELRNPLAGLRLYACHLEQRLGRAGDEEGGGLARKISSTIDHLAAVVADITAFGRPPELQRAPTAVHAVLDECLGLARARCPAEGVEVVRRYDPGCPEGLLDARELRKGFLNLILNGLEALGPGGRLTVTTTYAPETGEAEIVIEDTGVGMSEETRTRVFDLFYTTKPQGTGLGMAIVRSVVDRHGGHLAIDSAPGRGTRVNMRLPLTDQVAPRAAAEAGA